MTVTLQLAEAGREFYSAPKGGLHSPGIKWDAAGNRHDVVIYQAGTSTDDSTMLRYTKRGADGAVLDEGAIRPPLDGRTPPSRCKFDELGALQVIVPPGGGLGSIVVPYCDHGANDPAGNTRVSHWGYVLIPGVYTPHARGLDPDEQFDIVLPDTGQQGGDVDYAEVRRIVHEEVTAGMAWFDSLLGSQAPREDIKGLIQDTLLFMYDPQNFDPTGQDATKAKPTRFQTVQYNKFLQDTYVALNKQITGENTQLPVANQGFINLITRIVHGTEPQAPQQGVVTAEDQHHMDLSGPMGATMAKMEVDKG